MIEQTRRTLQDLKCSGMLKSLDIRLSEATSNGWGHIEFLSSLIQDEKMQRETNKIKRRLKAAKFRVDACIEKIDTTAKRNITKTQVQTLAQLQFIKQSKNVMLFGPTGVGKTYLASALGNHACRNGYSCIFIGMNMLIDRLAMSRTDGSYLRFRDKLITTDLLILDDLGIKPLPPQAIHDFYDLLEERYQSKATIITSQLPFANWKEVIEDAVSLEAILDRLMHGSLIIDLKGESYRKIRCKNEA